MNIDRKPPSILRSWESHRTSKRNLFDGNSSIGSCSLTEKSFTKYEPESSNIEFNIKLIEYDDVKEDIKEDIKEEIKEEIEREEEEEEDEEEGGVIFKSLESADGSSFHSLARVAKLRRSSMGQTTIKPTTSSSTPARPKNIHEIFVPATTVVDEKMATLQQVASRLNNEAIKEEEECEDARDQATSIEVIAESREGQSKGRLQYRIFADASDRSQDIVIEGAVEEKSENTSEKKKEDMAGQSEEESENALEVDDNITQEPVPMDIVDTESRNEGGSFLGSMFGHVSSLLFIS